MELKKTVELLRGKHGRVGFDGAIRNDVAVLQEALHILGKDAEVIFIPSDPKMLNEFGRVETVIPE